MRKIRQFPPGWMLVNGDGTSTCRVCSSGLLAPRGVSGYRKPRASEASEALGLPRVHCRGLPGRRNQMVYRRAGLGLNRLVAAAKYSCASDSSQLDRVLMDSEHRSFAKSDHWSQILLQELNDPLLLRFTHMGRVRFGIEIVWANLKTDEPQCFEGRRLYDGHVVGCLESGAGNI